MTTFINTRPRDRAKPLSQALIQAGISVLELPLLEMLPIPVSIEDKLKLQNLANGDYDVLVVVSPTAAKIGLTNSAQINAKNIIAVGEATATVLRERGHTVIVPKVSSNEGMLALACIEALTPNKAVMIWRGQGGRHLLIDTLTAKGVSLDVVEFYKRHLPAQTLLSFDSVCAKKHICTNTYDKTACNKKSIATKICKLTNAKQRDDTKETKAERPIVLISSSETFKNWQKVLDCHGYYQLDDFIYFVLGSRLANMIHQKKLRFKQITSLQPKHILSLL